MYLFHPISVDCYWSHWMNEECVLDNGRVCGDGGTQKSTRIAIIDLLNPVPLNAQVSTGQECKKE